MIVAALSSASFRMVGPVYGQDVGLSTGQIAWFLSAFVLGGALAQYPVGWLADKYDRRWVLFGLTTFPIYSVAAAHAHDFASDDERVELSAALMFFYAIGAIAAPYVASALITTYGPGALFGMISVGHGVLIIFGLTRLRARPTKQKRTRYIYAPRTSFVIGRLIGRSRERD